MNGTIGVEEMKRQMELFLIILLPILGLVFLGGKIMHLTKRSEQKVTDSYSKKVIQKSKEEIKKEQVAYLKEHEQEIVDFVKAQNSKIETVQIDWTDVRWSDGGFLLPDYSIEVYETVNHIENSGWSASMPINDDDSIDLKKISIFNDITIGEEILE
ncbi:MAG: hypothetical protein E6740_01660 [Streptococcus parasanguinis]|uniref:hypothetical protein n=1 Tax=Streptococcus parasanguinis TaxID=1318 RepID=UPI00066A7C0D|nr:hypothetical protein [Streptococcus parasanguinis]MDU1975103.1 hypothetical protein [Streptococcus parasanguinis]